MNWYKKAQQNNSQERWQYDDETAENYYEDHDSHMVEQVRNFNDSKPGSRQPWRLIPLNRLKKIWAEYMTLGFVRDVKGVELIEDIILENVKKIHANTILMGHTTQNHQYILDEYETTMNETREHDYGDWATDDKGAWRISDYALGNLVNGAMEMMHAKTPEAKVPKIDFILNLVHQRSDIASWFVEGGISGLDSLKNQVI
jgi:hypothetical protein